MSISTEVETKLEIDSRGFQLIRAAGTTVRRIEQLNVYYDYGWQLADCAATFRIRFCPSQSPRVTLKVPQSWEDGRRTSREFDVGIEAIASCGRAALRRRIDVADLPHELGYGLFNLGVDRLLRVGWVRNTRYVIQLSSPETIELDCLKLPGGNDFFEVEVEEANAKIHRMLVERVLALVPSARRSYMSKFERFRAAVSEFQKSRPVTGAWPPLDCPATHPSGQSLS